MGDKANERCSTDKTRAGVLLSNQNDQPQTFYFVPNDKSDCTPHGSAGGGAPDGYITLTKEQGEVFIPRPSGYTGRIMRGPAPGSGPTPDLGLSRRATYAEINMDAFSCVKGDPNDPYVQGFKAAEVTISLNNGYDGPIYAHSTDSELDWTKDAQGNDKDPLWAGFKEDLFASAPQPSGSAVPTTRDGVKVGGFDPFPAGSMVMTSGDWTTFYGAHLKKYTIPLKVNYGGGTTSEVAYWGNMQQGAQVVMSQNYVVRVAFY